MKKREAKAILNASINSATNDMKGEMMNLLQIIVQQEIDKIALNMEAQGMSYKGNIEVEINGTQFRINIPSYLYYVDEGVNGTEVNYGSRFNRMDKKPPIEFLKTWIDEKGLEMNEYALQNHIHKNGIRPRNIFGNILDNLNITIQNFLMNTLKDKIIQQLNKTPKGRKIKKRFI